MKLWWNGNTYENMSHLAFDFNFNGGFVQKWKNLPKKLEDLKENYYWFYKIIEIWNKKEYVVIENLESKELLKIEWYFFWSEVDISKQETYLINIRKSLIN